MKKFKIEYFGKTYDVYPHIDKYTCNDTLAIRLMCCDTYEPFCNITVNLPYYTDKIKQLGFEYQFVDINELPNVIDFIIDNKLGFITKYVGFSGYCEYPLIKFDLKEFI